MKDIKRLVILFSLIWALLKGVFRAPFCRKEGKMPLGDAVAIETMRGFCQCKSMRGGGMIALGRGAAMRPSRFAPPPGYTYKKFMTGSVPAELLQKDGTQNSKLVFQLHGGAYMIGLSDTYRHNALKLSRISGGAAVFSIDYRTSPENVYPSALDDTVAGWEWLTANGWNAEDIILVGDSAGGNLALALTQKLRDQNRALPCAIICMSPWCDMAGEGASFTYNLYRDPMFGRKKGAAGGSYLDDPAFILAYAGKADLHDPYLSPVYGSFLGFPPMLIQVGTYEVLESDSLTVAQKARQAGVNVTLTRYPGMFHMFQLYGDIIPASKKAWEELGAYLQGVCSDGRGARLPAGKNAAGI